MRTIGRCRTWWGKHFLGAETVVALLATAAFVLWMTLWHGHASLDDFLLGRRGSIYGTVAGIAATLLGFVLAVAAIVLSFAESERFQILRESAAYPTLWRTFVSSIRVLCLATVVSVIALLADREPPDENVIVNVLFFFATMWATLRVVRTIWALEGIIGIATRPAKRDAG